MSDSEPGHMTEADDCAHNLRTLCDGIFGL